MNKYPAYVMIKNKKYSINTDFRVAFKCNEVAESEVSDEERALAIIFLLFGDEGLKDVQNWDKLLKIAIKYLKCDKEVERNRKEEMNTDLEQDWRYIKPSFFYDYGIDLDSVSMHYWDFYDKLCALSEKCIYNRVRFVRDFDISQIKDSKEKEKWIKQKETVALKQIKHKKTAREKELDDLFERQLRR